MSSLVVRDVLFTIVVPGAGGAYVPWLILTRHGALPSPAAWYALPLVILGVILYLSCVRLFAVVGRGTPGLWDPPRRFVVAGPYRWVRNPIYVAGVLIVSGEAWLFGSPALLLYAAGLAVAFHLFVVGHEEPRLRARFGGPYEAYRRTVPRWIPHRPHANAPPASRRRSAPVAARHRLAGQMLTAGSPARSSEIPSARLAALPEPQSPIPATTKSRWSRMRWIRLSSTGVPKYQRRAVANPRRRPHLSGPPGAGRPPTRPGG